jgi:hypothetical protein
LPQLQELRADTGYLSSLNISGSVNLVYVMCNYGQLTALDARNLPFLTTLSCRENQLQTLNISGSPNISSLDCGSNRLTTLDCSSQIHLQSLTCVYNQLTSLYIKNGIVEEYLSTNGNSFSYICADEQQIADLQLQYQGCVIDSSCSLNTANAFNDDNRIVIFPNPANDVLNIRAPSEITSIKIYDFLGQLLKSIPNKGRNASVIVSDLNAGNYVVLLSTASEAFNSRFVKL